MKAKQLTFKEVFFSMKGEATHKLLRVDGKSELTTAKAFKEKCMTLEIQGDFLSPFVEVKAL